MRFVERQTKPAQFGKICPMIAAEAVLTGNQATPLVEVKFLGDEIIDAFLKQYLFIAEGKIHDVNLLKSEDHLGDYIFLNLVCAAID